MNKIKSLSKVVVVFLCALIIISTTKITSYANSYGTISGNTYCVVTKVIDGETFEARDLNTGTYYLVRMIGVDSKGYDEAYQYAYDLLMGNKVLLTLDNLVSSPVGRWNYCYVRLNNEVINTKLIAMGYGEANVNTSNNTIYNQYATIEDEAKSNNLGMWGEKDIDGNSVTGVEYSEDSININTASASQISEKLTDVNSTLAKSIVSYRKYNPFTQVSDIKFVDGMTKSIYDKNKDKMHIVTNINEAYEYEISTLAKISDDDAEEIVDYRDKHKNIDLDDLYDNDIITESQYNANKNFVSDDDVDKIIYSVNSYGANINTATKSQLESVGLSSQDAQGIINIRDEGYTIKTIGELQHSDDVSLTDSGLRKLLDNIKVFTDINYSSNSELKSLFGSGYSGMSSDVSDIIDGRDYNNIKEVQSLMPSEQYQKIKDLIYVDKYENNYVNINTATLEQLISAGIDANTARLVVARQSSGIINDYEDLPNNIDLTSYDDSISLFTNINNTSVLELMTLSDEISSTFAQSIINYANDQPFGSMDEVYKFFAQNNQEDVYNDIEDYIVLY